jgi:hypothetical protein
MTRDQETATDALKIALDVNRRYSLPGTDLDKQANHIVARNVLDSELGKFADTQPIYRLDQDTRDRLIVHGRQDAAEALCQTRSLMDEIHQLKSALRNLGLTLWIGLAVFCFWQWSNSGFARWSWLEKLIGTHP